MKGSQKEQEKVSVRKPDTVWETSPQKKVDMDGLKKLVDEMPDGVMLEVAFDHG